MPSSGRWPTRRVTLMFGVIEPLGDLITTLPVGPEHPGRTAGPSFELFYESDYLLPHREAAWALLEERLRDAPTFCESVMQSSPEGVASALGPVERTLTAVADSVARALRGLGRDESLRDRRAVRQPTIATEEEPMQLRRGRQATVSRGRPQGDALRIRSLVRRRRLDPRRRPSSNGSTPARCRATERGPPTASPSSDAGSTPASRRRTGSCAAGGLSTVIGVRLSSTLPALSGPAAAGWRR